MFDDQPDARDVLRRRQAHAAKDIQHAVSSASSKPFVQQASTRCSPDTPEQSGGDMYELGFPGDTPGSRGGLSSGRYAHTSSWHSYSRSMSSGHSC